MPVLFRRRQAVVIFIGKKFVGHPDGREPSANLMHFLKVHIAVPYQPGIGKITAAGR